jgi:hypothetical protein
MIGVVVLAVFLRRGSRTGPGDEPAKKGSATANVLRCHNVMPR